MSVIPIKPNLEPEILHARMRRWERDIGRGLLPRRMQKPVIYFAGRMDSTKDGNDWRDGIEGFAGLYRTTGKVEAEDRDTMIDCDAFWYGGPFVMDNYGGHTSGHTPRVEVTSIDGVRELPHPEEHQTIWDIDKFQIERADLIVAYIDDGEAYGTLVEIGYAAALGKPIALGFSETMKDDDYDELWLYRMSAAKVYWGTPKEVWARVRGDWMRP